MNIEQEARSRHVAAFVEEALTQGMAADLPRRVAARLAGAARHRSYSRWLAAAALVIGIGVVVGTSYLQRGRAVDGAMPVAAASQDPVPDNAEYVLRVCAAQGEVAQGVEWVFGGRRIATWPELAVALSRAVQEVRAAVPPKQAKVVITPDVGTEWRHVVATTDAAHEAGFLQVSYAKVLLPRIIPKHVEEPQQAGAVVLPTARFAEPDEMPAEQRPVFDVGVDGSITAAGEVLFRPTTKTGADEAALRARLAELHARLAVLGEREVGMEKRKVLVTPMLIRAHRGAPWSSIAMLMRLASEPAAGFDKIELALAAGKEVLAEPAKLPSKK